VCSVIAHVDSGDGVAHEDNGTRDVGLNQKVVQFGCDVVCVARGRARFAESKSGAVVGANAGGFGQFGLDLGPDDRVIAQAGIEDEGWRAAAGAFDVHLAAADRIGLACSAMVGAEPEPGNRVVSGAGHNYEGAEDADGKAGSDQDALPLTRDFGTKRAEAAKAQPDDENPDEQNEYGSDLVVEIHEMPRRCGLASDDFRGLL